MENTCRPRPRSQGADHEASGVHPALSAALHLAGSGLRQSPEPAHLWGWQRPGQGARARSAGTCLDRARRGEGEDGAGAAPKRSEGAGHLRRQCSLAVAWPPARARPHEWLRARRRCQLRGACTRCRGASAQARSARQPAACEGGFPARRKAPARSRRGSLGPRAADCCIALWATLPSAALAAGAWSE